MHAWKRMDTVSRFSALVAVLLISGCAEQQSRPSEISTASPKLSLLQAGDGERAHLTSQEAPPASIRKPAGQLPPAARDAHVYPDPILRSRDPGDDQKIPKFHETVRKLRITILSDMIVSRRTRGEWGFSALIEGVDARNQDFSILFDTGAEPQSVWENACRMSGFAWISGECVVSASVPGQAPSLQERICKAKTVIISHNHQDHTGGLLYLRQKCLAKGSVDALATVVTGGEEVFYARPDFAANMKEDNYFLRPYFEKNLPPQTKPGQIIYAEMFKATGAGGRFVHSPQPKEIVPGVWTTGKVPRRTTYEVPYYQNAAGEVTSSNPMLGPDQTPYLDEVPEDQSLVINTTEGLVIVTGCAHAGIVNISNRALATTAVDSIDSNPTHHRIAMVVGGIHLITASASGLKRVVAGLRKAGVEKILGAHCTGLNVIAFLQNRAQLGKSAYTEKTAIFSTVGMIATFDAQAAKPSVDFEYPSGGKLNVSPNDIPGN
jgi:7,8-dihydropterin-6-yl-methyl-4-(beta-D-ribofuranosyl)aminobenzene 5'-phosphate synthase